MDADMQHDEKLLPQMLAILKSEPLDLVIGSSPAAGSANGIPPGRGSAPSLRACSRIICKAEIADPMSGFFMLRREALEGALRRLSGQGFEILLDILASSSRPLRFRELPYVFRERPRGESKLDALVAWEYMMLIADKLVGHIVPVRFALFAFVGGIGLVVHMGVLWFASTVARAAFNPAQTAATIVAMTVNFFLNNLFAYRDQRLRGLPVRGGSSVSTPSAPWSLSRMSASPAMSFRGTTHGGAPVLPASWSDRCGTMPSLPFSGGSKNDIANEALSNRRYPELGGAGSLFGKLRPWPKMRV
jgi:dolichol-phosphate mannosyltransferase